MHPELEALLALQEKDQAVTTTDEALAALAPELATLDEAHAAAERALAVARTGIQAAIDRRDELEGKIANYRSMQEQRRQRLEWVRGAKEASTLMAELDLARSVLAKEEAEFMRSGDAVTEAERKAAEAERALEEVRVRQAPLREGAPPVTWVPRSWRVTSASGAAKRRWRYTPCTATPAATASRRSRRSAGR